MYLTIIETGAGSGTVVFVMTQYFCEIFRCRMRHISSVHLTIFWPAFPAVAAAPRWQPEAHPAVLPVPLLNAMGEGSDMKNWLAEIKTKHLGSVFCSFLNTLSLGCHLCCQGAQLHPEVGLPWNHLEPSGNSVRQPRLLLTETHGCLGAPCPGDCAFLESCCFCILKQLNLFFLGGEATCKDHVAKPSVEPTGRNL